MLTHLAPAPAAPTRLVVLGAGGFLGRALLRRVSADGGTALAVTRAELDLSSEGAGDRLADLLRPGDSVVVLAAVTPDRDRSRAAFTANMRIGEAITRSLERSAPAHVVYVSSDAVYPFGDSPISESTTAAPTDLYGDMHLRRELMLATPAIAPLAILRPTMLYGAEDTHNAYGPNRFLRQAREEGRITLFGGGEEWRDTLAIDDAARLLWLVARHRSRGILNLASGQSITQAEMARRVAACFATSIQLDSAPRQVPVTHRRFDISALLRAFPYFAFTPLDEGLTRAASGRP